MMSTKFKKKQQTWILVSSFAVIVVLAILFTWIITKFSASQNVDNRVYAELKSTSTMQASTLTDHLEEQFEPLETVSNMLNTGKHFSSEEMQLMMNAMVSIHNWRMIGFADMEGNAIGHTGKSWGNISNRACFRNIVNGSTTRCYEYLPTTSITGEPRILFSVPAHHNGQMIGVVFCGIETNVLEDALFEHNDMFNASSIIFVCTSNGNMIVANESAHKHCVEVGVDDRTCYVYEQIPALEEMYLSGITKQKIDMHGTRAYASLVPLGVNDWLLGCIINETTATKAYATNLANIQKMITYVATIFVLALGYILIISFFFIKKLHQETYEIKNYYNNHRVFFQELNCCVVEYKPAASMPFSVQVGDDPYGIQTWDGSIETYNRYKLAHPEFDFKELEKNAELTIKNNRTYSFESIILINNEMRWVKIILVPNIDENDNPGIFGVVIDVSDIHSEFEQATEIFGQIPGGIHRCYLDDPIHLEYFSDSLCKMIGYSREEIEKIITSEHRYGLLIYPEDRPIFSEFVRNLAKTGGIQTCEYRMICKDGTLLPVADVMEAKRTLSGVMYGYSVVTDLHEYKEIQDKLEQELSETKQKLMHARIKNSYSQMQPHFLYNALASIREIVLDNPEYASDLIYDFSTHLRACIKSKSSDNLVPFRQELENVKAYVNIERMRFGEKLNVEYDCQELNFEIPPLSIQPLVENAIRHGVYGRGLEGGKVVVRVFGIDDDFQIVVADNGVGFDYDAIMDDVKTGKRDSTGLFSSIFRLETLMNAHVTVDSQIGIGTKIIVSVPKGGGH